EGDQSRVQLDADEDFAIRVNREEWARDDTAEKLRLAEPILDPDELATDDVRTIRRAHSDDDALVRGLRGVRLDKPQNGPGGAVPPGRSGSTIGGRSSGCQDLHRYRTSRGAWFWRARGGGGGPPDPSTPPRTRSGPLGTCGKLALL